MTTERYFMSSFIPKALSILGTKFYTGFVKCKRDENQITFLCFTQLIETNT